MFRTIGWIGVTFSLLLARENPFVAGPQQAVVRAPETVRASRPETSVSPGSGKAAVETVVFQNMRLLFSPGQVKIETKDRLLKHFAIAKPTAIILDFKSDADFPTRRRAVKTPPFKEIRMGIHPGFYRAVLETNASVAYRIEPFRYGYILTLEH